MPKFSKRSKEKLDTCHMLLQDLFNEVIKHYDCTILDGYRDKQAQDTALKNGNSKLRYPMSMHNKQPSFAVDVMPYPIKWDDDKNNYMFVGFVKAVAITKRINIRCGADWDKFIDIPHYELIL
jgi:peptidoglycan L-alanyl-D-glutamate endopeptidase CwlK